LINPEVSFGFFYYNNAKVSKPPLPAASYIIEIIRTAIATEGCLHPPKLDLSWVTPSAFLSPYNLRLCKMLSLQQA
jgi:hypothetical protein